MPAPAYVSGFLRSYSQYLELDPDLLVARYATSSNVKDIKPHHRMPMTTRPPQRSVPAVASMLVLFAAVAYGGWSWVKGDEGNSINTKIAAKEIERPLERNAIAILDTSIDDYENASGDNFGGQTESSESAIDIGVTTLGAGVTTNLNRGAPPAFQKIIQTTNMPVIAKSERLSIASAKVETSVLPDKSSEGSKELGGLAPSEQYAETQILVAPYTYNSNLQNSGTAIANLRDPSQEITIRAVASSWVEIVRNNGEEVLAKLMQAGDIYVVESNAGLYLSTGNAGGLTVLIGSDDPITVGNVGEIVRDLPLVKDKLRKAL